jgi:septal ring factor EnvC (AmiA/AmiB activator)
LTVRIQQPRDLTLMLGLLGLIAAGLLIPSQALAATGEGKQDKRLTRTLKRERSALRALEALSSQVVHSGLELEELQRHQTALDYRLGEADRRVKALEQRSAQRRKQIRSRTRSLYKLSRGGFARLILDAGDGRNVTRRLSALRRILRRDVRERQLYRKELDQLATQRKELDQQRRKHAAIKRRQDQRRTQLKLSKLQQRRLLQRVTASRRMQSKLQEELTRQQRRLLRQISTLTYELRWAGGFAGRKGRLPRPVRGRVVGVFGRGIDRKHRIEVLRHGLTFRPRRAASVKAVARGVVRMAGPVEGYGQLALLDHGDGFFTLYGFLASVAVKTGEEIKHGQRLGRAGLDPLTGEPALYFEVRRKERALDPSVWIRR